MKHKIHIQLLPLFASLILILQSCENTPKETVEYLHSSGDQSVRLKILTGNDYLIYNTPTRLDFEWTNIQPEMAIIGGTGIKMLGYEGNKTKTEFTVTTENLKTDTLHITILYRKNDRRVPASFHIPVREKE
tara:strand:+ start:2778 stop:3173 length:396 start_codon:yes stop_codon:yes gene_type:complete